MTKAAAAVVIRWPDQPIINLPIPRVTLGLLEVTVSLTLKLPQASLINLYWT
jgi:hypothetical protein